MADLDSLPSNWDATNFVATPTIGQADESNPSIRYVVASDVKEANRIYKSLIAGSATDEVSNDTWTKEGIGTLKFNVKNESMLYATLDVDVQQLPTLSQIQFVPASALGNNASSSKEVYYRPGDVVVQQLSNGKSIYWVCVKPYTPNKTEKRSFWCTFQLADDNYVNKGSKSKKKILPTKLCNKQAEGIQMIPNFFSLLFAMAENANTQNYLAKNANGIPSAAVSCDFCGLNKSVFTADYLRSLAYMWDYYGLWANGKVANANFVHSLDRNVNNGNVKIDKFKIDYPDTPLKKRFSTYHPMDALYYGYNSIWFSSGDYKVYNLHMSASSLAAKIEAPMYASCTPQTAYVDEDVAFDFSQYEKGYLPTANQFNLTWDDGSKTTSRSDQFIVRCKSGAELENTWSSKDKDPYNSFEKRQSSNGIKDVLVAKKHLDDKTGASHIDEATGATEANPPYFAFGDYTTESKFGPGFQFCIKEANSQVSVDDKTHDENKYTFFLCGPEAQIDQDKGQEMTQNMTMLVLIHLMNAYLNQEIDHDNVASPCVALNIDETLQRLYYRGLNVLYNESGIFDKANNNKFKYIGISRNGDTYTLIARFKSGVYGLSYDQGATTYTLLPHVTDDNLGNTNVATLEDLPLLSVVIYDDKYSFREEFSQVGVTTLGKTQSERKALRKTMPTSVIQPWLQKKDNQNK